MKQLTMEPNQALEYCVNLVRNAREFVCEIDPTLPGMKDVVAVHVGATFQVRADTHDYIRKRAVTCDEACQYVVNLIHAEQSFQVTPEQGDEYLVIVERLRVR